MEVPKCLTKMSEYAKTAASTLSRQMSKAGESLKRMATKVSATTAPYFEKIKIFASQNKGPITVGVICLLVGAAIASAISCMWRGNNNPPSIPNPTPVPTPTTT